MTNDQKIAIVNVMHCLSSEYEVIRYQIDSELFGILYYCYVILIWQSMSFRSWKKHKLQFYHGAWNNCENWSFRNSSDFYQIIMIFIQSHSRSNMIVIVFWFDRIWASDSEAIVNYIFYDTWTTIWKNSFFQISVRSWSDYLRNILEQILVLLCFDLTEYEIKVLKKS